MHNDITSYPDPIVRVLFCLSNFVYSGCVHTSITTIPSWTYTHHQLYQRTSSWTPPCPSLSFPHTNCGSVYLYQPIQLLPFRHNHKFQFTCIRTTVHTIEPPPTIMGIKNGGEDGKVMPLSVVYPIQVCGSNFGLPYGLLFSDQDIQHRHHYCWLHELDAPNVWC